MYENKPMVILGLSLFGMAVAEQLADDGIEVLAIDADPEAVALASEFATVAAEGDITKEALLSQLGVHEYERALVAVGNKIEPSVLAVALLVDLGVKEIWAQAADDKHARILQRMGAHKVVVPDGDMGRITAHHLVGKSQLVSLTFDGTEIALAAAPRSMVGKPVLDNELTRAGITVLAVRRGAGSPVPPTPDMRLNRDDVLVIWGPLDQVEKFV